MMARFTKGVSVAALVASLGLTGCSGGDDDGGVAQFVGKWQWTTGSEQATCNGTAFTPTQLSGSFNVSRGTDAPLVIDIGPNCNLRFQNNGSAATVRGGQTCLSTAGGATITLNYTAGTMIVTGFAAMVSAGGNFTYNEAGQTFQCTFTQGGTAMKVGQ